MSGPHVESIARSPPSPDDQVLESIDVMYLQRYHNDLRLMDSRFFKPYDHLTLRCFLGRFGIEFISKPVRYAALLSVCFREEGTNSNRVLTHSDRFYKSTREAINSNSYADLVYSCYIACLYSFTAHRYNELVQHGIGLLQSFQNLLLSTTLAAEEIYLTKSICKQIFELVIYEFERRRVREQPHWKNNIELAFNIVNSALFLSSPNSSVGGSGRMYEDDQKIVAQVMMYSFEIYLVVYILSKELSQTQCALHTEFFDNASACLDGFLKQTSSFIPKMMHFRDILNGIRHMDQTSEHRQKQSDRYPSH